MNWFNKRKIFTVVFFLFFQALLSPGSIFCQSFSYKFNYLTIDEGLSHTDANDIVQDKRGYMWVATFFGIDRFDGYSIKKFYNENTPIYNAFKNRVMCIYPDQNDNLWLGTEYGLQCFNAKTQKYIDYNASKKSQNPSFSKIYKPTGNYIYGLTNATIKLYLIKGNTIEEQALNIPPNLLVTDMATDSSGLIYLSTNNGLWIIDRNNKVQNVTITGIKEKIFSKIYLDNRKNLLLATRSKIILFKLEALKSGKQTSLDAINSFSGSNYKSIGNIIENKKSDYWVNTYTGLLRLDSNLKFIQIINNKNSTNSLNSNGLTKVYIDRTECLWVSTYGGGVNYCDLNEKLFYTLHHNPEVTNALSGNHIRSILEDGENVWIGTNENGLNLFNLKTQSFTYYNTYNSTIRLKNDVITSLTFDNEHKLWIGSGAGIEILNQDRKKLWKPPGYDKFPGYIIETLAKDCFGNIWFGNHVNKFGVIWKDKNNKYNVRYYGEGYFIFADRFKPELFISSTHGLSRAVIDKNGNITKSYTYNASLNKNSLSSNYTYPICQQNDSTYWIGTIGGGLNRFKLDPKSSSYSFESYNGNYGVFNDVESLEIDNSGNLWMGGNGLEYFNPSSKKLIRYDKNDGLQGNSFKVGSSYKGSDGRLYFGGINGLNYFYPNQIRANRIAAIPILTDILINNQKPRYGKSGSSSNSINQAIGYDKELTLNYLQNNFVIYFSSMHFANPLKCKYRYKLIGFDKDWKFTDGKNPQAAYSNLDYKDYNFIVEATNNDGIWSDSNTGIAITLTPPWWKSDLAKLFYGLFIFSILSIVYVFQGRWYRLKREIEIRAVNENKREEMHKQRMDLYQQQLLFFTNVSHEFRTPLTLILGPLESLISQNKNAALDYSYQLMFRNAKRLINLISELMNFKKVADSIIKLQVRPIIINQFCKDLAWEFHNLAVNKGIQFEMIDSTKNELSQMTGYFDVQVLEKILFNLLNNSFKYTNAGGQISFEIFFDIESFKPSFSNGFELLNQDYRAKKYIYFLVSDSGIGISGESITKIFDRYYRISKTHLGSGVGLALVKSLTQLHKGDIYVYSERYKGTEIIIGIPWAEENYIESEKASPGTEVESQLEVIDNAIHLPLAEQDHDAQHSHSKLQKHILIVDDNYELRSFLKHAFENLYTIYEATDGNSAIEIATEKVPDLIISDVMMPGMDGIEFCKIIKDQFETRHIPFIILSAKDALDTKMEGMESGADFYFAKPLSIELLLITVHNIFEQSEKLKQKYTQNYLSEATELVHSEKDKEFFQKLLNLIEDNLNDIDLDVDFLCTHLYISRTKLYHKIKSISDQSVGNFIRTIRLKKAIQIMTHEDIAMNEVVDRIGFQSSSNFSRAFKKEYGKSPLQFMQALKKN